MTINAIRDTTQATERCPLPACQAKPGQPCTCTPGLHLARVACACRDGHIKAADFAAAVPDDGIFVPGTVVVLAGAR